MLSCIIFLSQNIHIALFIALQQISKFRQLLPIDGIWLDMNEIASFHDGEISDDKHPSTLNDPPYAIDNQGSKKPLMKKTVSPDAVHYGGLKEYDVHNLYG